LKEAFLTVGMLLLFTEVISTIIAFVGGALVMRNR
jgi:hypothetical protein